MQSLVATKHKTKRETSWPADFLGLCNVREDRLDESDDGLFDGRLHSVRQCYYHGHQSAEAEHHVSILQGHSTSLGIVEL